MRRFVVLRRYEAVETRYVEASTASAARERVFPADPERDPYFALCGGAEPTNSAVTREVAITTRAVRRFPANVTVFYGSLGTERTIGPAGEPPKRYPS